MFRLEKKFFVKGTPHPGIARNCYGYAAGGMPLAFTQEDFLLVLKFCSFPQNRIFALVTLDLVMCHHFTKIDCDDKRAVESFLNISFFTGSSCHSTHCSQLYQYLKTLISGRSRIFQRRGSQPQGGGPTCYLTNFCRKLHENKEFLAWRRREGCPSRPP